jgi:2-polyprenyl-3-methyl-5-hydroxy-6-metoxy-1,4-benzoquinol methylase
LSSNEHVYIIKRAGSHIRGLFEAAASGILIEGLTLAVAKPQTGGAMMSNVSSGAKRSHDYELGHTDGELRRLATQTQLVDPITRSYFERAGVGAGMRVLDVGSGAGDVAFLAAGMVGPNGLVIGTDRSPTAVAAAQTRANELVLANVTFRDGDPSAMSFEQHFDAIVGRYVLMFSPDPVAMLRGVARHLKPGGIVVFHEVDWTGAASFPPAPTFNQCHTMMVQTFRKIGTNANMGLQLRSAFLGAGLPAPDMGLQALVGGGDSGLNGIDLVADLAITMAPVMEQQGVIAADSLRPRTLNKRMRAEAEANGSVVVGRYEVGAWTRVK